MKNIDFIHKLFSYEKQIQKAEYNFSPDKKDIIDKYINGECEVLVDYLYLLNNKEGEKIEIIEENDYGNIYHYVYLSPEGYFYDINGEHNCPYELASELYYIEEPNNVEVFSIEIDKKEENFIETTYNETVNEIINC